MTTTRLVTSAPHERPLRDACLLCCVAFTGAGRARLACPRPVHGALRVTSLKYDTVTERAPRLVSLVISALKTAYTPQTHMSLLQLIPEYHARVWGGSRLKPEAGQPIGEAWIVYEGNRIAVGPQAGRTLADVAHEQGAALLGEAALRRTGTRFPLLIKLLDCRDWLSVQVHPNDQQALQLEGPGQFGKTEAWHLLEAAEGAQIVAGLKPGATPETLATAIRTGGLLDWIQYHPAHSGDTVFMPAGTIHALGPGLFLYEVQQTSDITYRVFDWGRPANAGRALHIEQSLAVTNPQLGGQVWPRPALRPGEAHALVSCPYFQLDLLLVEHAPLHGDTHGDTFQALTVIEGEVEVVCGTDQVHLKRFETVLLPANSGAYHVSAPDAASVLCARGPSVGAAS